MFELLEGTKRRIPNEYCYYRNRLSVPACRIYDRICDAMCSLKTEVEIDRSCFSSFDVSIIQGVLYDQPLLYFVSGKNIRAFVRGSRFKVMWTFETDVKTIAEYDRLIMNRIRRMYGEIRQSTTDFVRLVSLHELLQNQGIAAQRGKSSWKDYCIIGPLLERKTLCEGMAKLFYMLCAMSQIRCFCITGNATDHSGNNVRHAWNIVAVSDTFAHVDIFWDILLKSPGGICCYDYFCIDDSKMRGDHSWNSFDYPACVSQRFDRFASGGWIAGRDCEYEKLASRLQAGYCTSLTVRMLYPFDAQRCASIAKKYLHVGADQSVYYRVNNRQHILEVFAANSAADAMEDTGFNNR